MRRCRPLHIVLGRGGQSTVEFALVLPVLLLVVVAVCQVALALNCYLVVTASSREGARRGAETNNVDEARDAALAAAGGLPGEKPTVKVSFPGGRSKGTPIKVTVSYRMPYLIPGLEKLVPGPEFNGTTSMALEKSE